MAPPNFHKPLKRILRTPHLLIGPSKVVFGNWGGNRLQGALNRRSVLIEVSLSEGVTRTRPDKPHALLDRLPVLLLPLRGAATRPQAHIAFTSSPPGQFTMMRQARTFIQHAFKTFPSRDAGASTPRP
ncbi:uncharacterized protein Tco025E_09224 [Trypanosoma conorhini]|uniref:Uncharacterized protein n=1 Tax=Trypanosoma conorhini TaxID=83891 RepID=A0A422MZA5_9TRYP|nr:uncharacterized protein Tco025E_09224 [Trypanosoma conorhini]RNE98470.1 hypothetical protein Tco025E_09224 [Trypanosoma conorhini]